MPLTILQVAYPFSALGDAAVGGAEQVLTTLDRELTRRGQRSIVIACEGSQCAGTLLTVPRADRPFDAHVYAHVRSAIAQVTRSTRVDVVHLHGVDFPSYLPEPSQAGPPLLATLHLPAERYPLELFVSQRSDLYLQCVSRSAHARCPASTRFLPPIPNGVPLERLGPARRKRSFALMLGRICPEKGFEHALRAAREADIALWIGGQVFDHPEHRAYFEGCIRPLLDARRRLLGPLSFERKRRLLAAASCLLVPSVVAETSSLVTMEALACGTPVIAFANGALPDLIEDGHTGFVVRDARGMRAAIARVAEIDPKLCRASAERRFSALDMVDRYVQVYEQLRPRAHASGSLQALTFTALEELEKLTPAWRKLYARCPDATPFQSPDWLINYARCFGVSDLRTLALYHSGELVGLAACVLYRRGEERVLSLLGGGISDYQNVLFAPEHKRSCCDAWIGWLREQRDDWDRCEFEQVPPRSALHARMLAGLGVPDEQVQDTCPALHAFSTGLVAALPTSLLKNLRYAERKLQSLGALRFERAEAHGLAPLLAALAQLHAARWRERGTDGVLNDDAVLAFHRAVAPGFLATGSLRMYALRLDERVIAVFYGFCERDRFYYYLGGFDPQLAKYSPGALILKHAIDEADREAAHVFEFLRGAESYKYVWGAHDVWVRRISVAKQPAARA